jgi:hypothetical protein
MSDSLFLKAGGAKWQSIWVQDVGLLMAAKLIDEGDVDG